jgi:hypothetical protein
LLKSEEEEKKKKKKEREEAARRWELVLKFNSLRGRENSN